MESDTQRLEDYTREPDESTDSHLTKIENTMNELDGRLNKIAEMGNGL